MPTPFLEFRNTIVRIPKKVYSANSGGFIKKTIDKDDYLDVVLFLEKGSSRNPTTPSALDSFEGIKAGVNVFPLKGFFCDPERIPLEVQMNTDYPMIYKPDTFDSDSTIQYGELRFVLTPLDPVNADFFTGDVCEVIMILRNAKNEDESYPEWL